MRQMQASPSPGFSGPSMEELPRPRRSFPRLSLGPTVPRLPASVRRELETLSALGAATPERGAMDFAKLADVDRTLVQRITLGGTRANYARIEQIGYTRYLEEQLDFEKLDNSELEDSLAEALPTLTMSPDALFRNFESNPFVPVFELWAATLFRAIYSPRQLFERVVELWSDHFNIDIFADFQPLLKPVDDRDVIRANAMRRFPDLLTASAHSPSMLVYLTNDSNVRGFANENYAREIMELHTLGADNGYTEKDVKELARIFTGWTWVTPYREAGEVGTFAFYGERHDRARKRFLNRDFPSGKGVSEGERVLKILGDHDNTADFIARKILIRFWGYEPDQALVNRVKNTYKRAGGSVRAMLRTALEKQSLRSAMPKIKRPFHLVTSAMRATGASIGDPSFLIDSLRNAGQLPFNWEPPDGYPDDEAYWSGFILPRWNFAANAMQPGRSPVEVAPALASTKGGKSAVLNRINRFLFDGQMSSSSKTELRAFLNKGRLNPKRVREAIGIAISAPEFQQY